MPLGITRTPPSCAWEDWVMSVWAQKGGVVLLALERSWSGESVNITSELKAHSLHGGT